MNSPLDREAVVDEAWRVVIELERMGCRGDYSFEMLDNDDTQPPLPGHVERARRSAAWPAKGVLHRAVALPGASRWRGECAA
jgi:hypothetical protein